MKRLLSVALGILVAFTMIISVPFLSNANGIIDKELPNINTISFKIK